MAGEESIVSGVDRKCSNCGNWNSKYVSNCTFCGLPLSTAEHIPPIMQIKPWNLIEASRRKVMNEKREQAPKVKGKEAYVCPSCLEETLVYDEEDRLFMCRNQKCGKGYALAEVG